jgi:hypothetical protein
MRELERTTYPDQFCDVVPVGIVMVIGVVGVVGVVVVGIGVGGTGVVVGGVVAAGAAELCSLMAIRASRDVPPGPLATRVTVQGAQVEASGGTLTLVVTVANECNPAPHET